VHVLVKLLQIINENARNITHKNSISSVHAEPMYSSDECLINYITLQSRINHTAIHYNF
jgi:hypothetical protein